MKEARIELLQRMPIFGGINGEVLNFLFDLCPVVHVAAGEFFFHELEKGDSMFVLERGNAVVLKSCRGEQQLLKTLTEGDCFGEMAVMDHGPRTASVRAIDDCVAIHISSAALYQIYGRDLKQFALIQMNMGREVCRRLREADRLLSALKLETRDGNIERAISAD